MENLNVEKIKFKILTHDEIDELSSGEITEEGTPYFKDSTSFRLPERGLYSEEIFGPSIYTEGGKLKVKEAEGFDERKARFGHIRTPLYINPHLINAHENTLVRILAFEKASQMMDILNYEAYLVFVPVGDPEAPTYAIKYQKSKIKFAYPPRGMEGTFYFIPVKGTEDTNSELGRDFRNMYESENILITSGVFAMLLLISRLNFKIELLRCSARINSLNEEEALAVAEGGKLKGKSETLRILSVQRYNILYNFIKQGITPKDLISNKLLVIPAGWRDINLIKDVNGRVRPNKPKINDRYTDILSMSKVLLRVYKERVTLDDVFDNPNDLTWVNKIRITESNFRRPHKNLQEKIQLLYKEEIQTQIGVKKGKIRQAVLSKRLDFTGRGVITPDPSLKLDEIGVPIYILLEFYKSRFKELSRGSDNYTSIINYYTSNKTINRFSIMDKENSNLISTDDNIQGQEGPPIQLIPHEDEYETNNINLIKEIYEMIGNHRQLAVRFPSLHRYSCLGFKVKVVFDTTIHLHPLVCAPYNADFDGDNMSLYLIETPDGIKEVDEKLLPSKNIFNSNGKPHMTPSQDAVLGTYFLTLKDTSIKGYDSTKVKKEKEKIYTSYDKMFRDYEIGRLRLHETVTVKLPRYDNSLYMRNYFEYILKEKHIDPVDKHQGIDYYNLPSNTNQVLINGVPELPTYTVKPEKYITSTVGRFILNTYIPQDLGYVDRNEDPYSLEIDKYLDDNGKAGLDSSGINDVITRVADTRDIKEVVFLLDSIKEMGYNYATESAMSISLGDIYTHPDKDKLVNEAQEKVHEIEDKQKEKLISEKEANEKKIEIWTKVNDNLAKKTMEDLPDNNPIKMMSVSGSRGNVTQITQLMGMRGLMANTSGETIPTPVVSSFLEALSMPEYFISSYGTRKGMYDRSNRTKGPGQLTRTAVYANSKMVITEGDCGDISGYHLRTLYKDKSTGLPYKLMNGEKEIDRDKYEIAVSLGDRAFGKIVLQDILDEDGNVIVKSGHLIERKHIKTINKLYEFEGIRVRSPLTCKSRRGVCAKCYGKHLGLNRFSRVGDSVGTIAAQTIGEPGTQLTMRTFHTGGVAKGDITGGFDAMAAMLENKGQGGVIDGRQELMINHINIEGVEGAVAKVKNNILRYKQIEDKLIPPEELDYSYFGVYTRDGEDDYVDMLERVKERMQMIYVNGGIRLSDVHYEVTTKTMGSEFKVIYKGDTTYQRDHVVTWADLVATNIAMVEKGAEPMIVVPHFKSIKEVASSANNPMLSILFQNMSRSLSRSIAVNGESDTLNPLMSVAVSNRFISPTTFSEFNEILEKEKNRPIFTQEEEFKMLGIKTFKAEEEKPAELLLSKDKFGFEPIEKEETVGTDVGLVWDEPEEAETEETPLKEDDKSSSSLFSWDTNPTEEIDDEELVIDDEVEIGDLDIDSLDLGESSPPMEDIINFAVETKPETIDLEDIDDDLDLDLDDFYEDGFGMNLEEDYEESYEETDEDGEIDIEIDDEDDDDDNDGGFSGLDWTI